MSDRKVNCVKLKEELPGLKNPPFAGDLGKEIFEKVSERGWRMWSEDMMIKVINEYRLNLADAVDYEKLMTQMKIFLNLETDNGNSLEVGNPDRGR